jgi:hypothetical protein
MLILCEPKGIFYLFAIIIFTCTLLANQQSLKLTGELESGLLSSYFDNGRSEMWVNHEKKTNKFYKIFRWKRRNNILVCAVLSLFVV